MQKVRSRKSQIMPHLTPALRSKKGNGGRSSFAARGGDSTSLFTLYILLPFTASRMVAVAGDLRGVQGTSKRSLKATASTV